MTQTIVPRPAAPTVPTALPDVGPAPSPARRLARARAELGRWLEGSPGRLRVVAILVVIAALLVAVGGFEALRIRSSALGDAAQASDHLVQLQTVEAQLQRVDADATNSFLTFGLEPLDQRQDYIAKLKQASDELVAAGQESPADASALGAANAALTRYSGLISSARAYNRLGKPVGASYLTTASALLHSDVLSQMDRRVQADQARISAAYSRAGNARWWLLLFTVLGVGGLLGAQVYLTLHSRRFLNLPLVGATAVVIVALLIGAGVMAFAQSHANSVRSGALTRAEQVSTARLKAFEAKSQESLTLVNRGSATQADPAWSADLQAAQKALPSGYTLAANALAAYAKAHQAINDADYRDGNWDRAVGLAISTGTGSANADFDVFDAQTAAAPAEQAKEAASGLRTARVALLPAGLLIGLAGLLAAAGAWWGVSLRLDEYR